MTQRIEPFAFRCDSKSWPLFLICLKELNLPFYMTQRIEPCYMTQRLEPLFLYDSKNWTSFLWLKELIEHFSVWLKELNLFFKTTHRIELFCKIRLKGLNFFWMRGIELNPFLNMTQRIVTFFSMTQRIEPSFWTFLNELNPFFLKKYDLQELNLLFQHDSKNWTFFYIDSKNWTFFLHNSTTSASSIKYDLRKYDSKNWHLFLVWLKELNLRFYVTQWIEPLFSLTQRIELFFCQEIWLKELNFFHGSKNLNLLFNEWLKELKHFLNQRIEPFFKNTTQRTERFFNMTQRIEYDSKVWTFFLFQFDRKNFFIWLTELNPFVKYDSKNWTIFWMWLQELNFECDSKNWTFFWMWLKESNLFFFLNGSQRFEPSLRKIWLTEIEPFFSTWLIEIEPFFSTWLIEIEPFFLNYDSKKLMFFETWLIQLNLFLWTSFQDDSKNWTF